MYPVIECMTNEPIRGWKLRSRMIFTASGMIDEKTNFNRNLSTNKTYVRIDADSIAREEHGLLDFDATTRPPLTDDDWMTWE